MAIILKLWLPLFAHDSFDAHIVVERWSIPRYGKIFNLPQVQSKHGSGRTLRAHLRQSYVGLYEAMVFIITIIIGIAPEWLSVTLL